MAKLPFVPLSYIQGLSHRNLLGEDYTDCSFIFLYILCTMSIRQVSSTLTTTLPLGFFNDCFWIWEAKPQWFRRICVLFGRGQPDVTPIFLAYLKSGGWSYVFRIPMKTRYWKRVPHSRCYCMFVLCCLPPEHSEDARSGTLESCYETGRRLPGASSSSS